MYFVQISFMDGLEPIDCRVRFLSFLGIGKNVQQAAFVMHTAQVGRLIMHTTKVLRLCRRQRTPHPSCVVPSEDVFVMHTARVGRLCRAQVGSFVQSRHQQIFR
jgi:hypothetical protein